MGIFFFITSIFLLFIIIGATFNFVVVTENNGKMPVPAYISEEGYLPFKDKSEVNYYLLSDIIKFNFLNRKIYMSVGDIFALFGVSGILVISTWKFKKSFVERRK